MTVVAMLQSPEKFRIFDANSLAAKINP